ncbi:hypothetical protein DFJ73DRAFT_302401 [Zopfochytrium polystomum]|nr:hypothetical protein DFJ73DRAFT_302401 [Zopfochytrium polystomum]
MVGFQSCRQFFDLRSPTSRLCMTPSPTTAARPARAADSPGAASKSTTLAKFVDDGDDILDSSGRIRFLTAERHSYASKRPPNPNPMLDEVEDGLWERRKRRAEERRSAESDSQKLGAKKKFVYRPRQTGTKIADPANFMPVQPWDTVRSSLETMTRSSKTGEDSVEQLESATVEENTALEGSGTAVTIPFGFQLLRRLPSSRSAIRSALHLPISTSTDHFVTIDSHNLSLWRGTSLKTRLAMASTRTIQSRSTRTPTTTVPQIQKWMYIEKFHVFRSF